MKKLKFLLFIIPLFFIFIGNSKAYDMYVGKDGTIIDEILVENKVIELNPNYDFLMNNR